MNNKDKDSKIRKMELDAKWAADKIEQDRYINMTPEEKIIHNAEQIIKELEHRGIDISCMAPRKDWCVVCGLSEIIVNAKKIQEKS